MSVDLSWPPARRLNLVRADAYFYGGLPEKSLPLIRNAIEQDAANVGAHWLLVVAYDALGARTEVYHLTRGTAGWVVQRAELRSIS